VLALTIAPGCATHANFPETDVLGPPQTEGVTAVVYLVGDAGAALTQTSPLLRALGNDVEAWAPRLDDGRVAVVFLGDNVYEVGVRDSTDPRRVSDEQYLRSQVQILAGAIPRRYQVRGIFIPGNHDWGNLPGRRGVARLTNQVQALQLATQETGANAVFLPAPGCPGPSMVDIQPIVRIVVLDSDWWLQPDDMTTPADCAERSRQQVRDALAAAVQNAGTQPVLIAAHHPLVTGGSHGGNLSVVGVHGFVPDFGLLYLANRSGTLVQDVVSAPYQHFIDDVDSALDRSTARPLVMAGGHDHNLQVIARESEGGPRYQLVSGAGSKLKYAGPVGGTLYAAMKPGFMQLLFRSSGRVELRVVAGSVTKCPTDDASEGSSSECVTAEAAAYTTVFSAELAPPR
jgi:hypothetical protein